MLQAKLPAFGQFYPLELPGFTVSGITGLTAEQREAILRPFLPSEAITAVASLQNFSVECSLVAPAPSRFRLEAFLYVLGSAGKYAAISYLPVPAAPVKSKLWRLGSEVHGGAIENSLSIPVTLPEAAKIARLAVRLTGIYSDSVPEPPEPQP